MTKADLVEAVQRAMDVGRREAAAVVDELFEVMRRALVKGERVKVSRFGLFVPRLRPAREGRCPRTGEPMALAAHHSVSFRASPRLKGLLEGAAATGRQNTAP